MLKKKFGHLFVAFAASATLLACGGGGSVSSNNNNGEQTSAAPAAGITVLAGHIGGDGNIDATGADARFNWPQDVAVDRTGNVYVADSLNFAIRRVSPAGAVTTLAGKAGSKGSVDGTGAAARFVGPHGVALDNAGTVYVADDRVVRKVTSAGVVTTLAGSGLESGSADGTGTSAHFERIERLAVDVAGNVYVTDDLNRNIRKITPSGEVTTLAGKLGGDCTFNGRIQSCVAKDGIGSAAAFIAPYGVVVDATGNVYVTDSNTIRKITPNGAVTTLAGTAGAIDSVDGTGTAARFYQLAGMAMDSVGNIYVIDRGNRGSIRKITPAGDVTTLVTAITEGYADGIGADGIAIDSAGNFYFANLGGAIRKISPAGVATTLAGTARATGSADGTGTAARFNFQISTASSGAVDGAGNVYVADDYATRKITPAGLVSTLAVTTMSGGVAFDGAGNLYVADYITVRKITPSGVVATVAGSATMPGSADGVGEAASFSFISGVAVDGKGNVFVTDANTIRKISPDRTVTTLAGLAPSPQNSNPFGTGSADGTGAAARFNGPKGIAADGAGNLYIADSNNNTIRKITPAGVVSTLAGTAGSSGSTDGAGTDARFLQPIGVAVDGAGNVFVTDSGNNTIRKITPAGTVTTVAGQAGSKGVVLGSLPGSLSNPAALAIAGSGVLYVTSANAVLKIQLPSQ